MAVDTRSKRASAVSFDLPFVMALPLPDGVLGQGDRAHLAMSYSGITSTSTPGEEGTGTVPPGINPNPSAIPTLTPQVFMVIEDL